MKITFINPPVINQLRDCFPEYINKDYAVLPPMGILYLASMLSRENKQYKINFIDAEADSFDYETIADMVEKQAADVVGITCTSFTFVDAYLTAKAIKSKSNDQIKIILGGAHASIYPKEVLSHKYFDIIIIGEGELTIVELIDAIWNKRSFAGIRGIAYRENGKVVINPGRGWIENLDIIPVPDRGMLRSRNYSVINSRKKKVAPIITSRGCPAQCAFCYHSQGYKYRVHSPDYIVNELDFLGLLMANDMITAEQQFLEQCFRPWFASFYKLVIDKSELPFYVIIVKLINLFTAPEE